jgi:hypothetical protein
MMMRALVAAVALASSGAAIAAPKVPATVSPADRAVPGRVVRVRLDQTEIATAIDLGRIAPVSGGDGLLGALLVSRGDDRAKTLSSLHRERAEAQAVPIRAVLQGVDVRAIALRTARRATSNTGWLATDRVSGIDDDLAPGGTGAAAAPASVTIAFRYDLSPDMSQVRVFADVALFRGGAARLESGYRQRFASIVHLRTPSYDPAENAAQWSRDGGRLVRHAIEAAFARLETTIPYALNLSAVDAAALIGKSHPQGFGAGIYGPLIARDATDPQNILLWSGAFIAVQPAS